MQKPPGLTDLDEIFCRIHLLELLMQNTMVNQLIVLPESESETAKEKILELLQNPKGSGNAKQFSMAQRIAVLAEQFLERLARAESNARTGNLAPSPRSTQ